jgi:hypothetical protein
VEKRGPVFAVFEIQFGLGLVAGRNPDVVFCPGDAGLYNGVIGIDVGNADLPGFFDNSERRNVVEPGDLTRVKVFLEAQVSWRR